MVQTLRAMTDDYCTLSAVRPCSGCPVIDDPLVYRSRFCDNRYYDFPHPQVRPLRRGGGWNPPRESDGVCVRIRPQAAPSRAHLADKAPKTLPTYGPPPILTTPDPHTSKTIANGLLLPRKQTELG